MSYIRILNIIRGDLDSETLNIEEDEAFGVHDPHEFLSPREEVAIEMGEIFKRDDCRPEISLWVFTPLEEELGPWRKLCSEQEDEWTMVVHQPKRNIGDVIVEYLPYLSEEDTRELKDILSKMGGEIWNAGEEADTEAQRLEGINPHSEPFEIWEEFNKRLS